MAEKPLCMETSIVNTLDLDLDLKPKLRKRLKHRKNVPN